MGRQRKNYTAAFEAQVALAAIRGDSTANDRAAKHGLHPTLVSNWKKTRLDPAAMIALDGPRVHEVLLQGLASPEHAAFVERMRQAAS